MAWKANFWAKVNDGGCAAVAEMLIQSHDGIVTLLPALPAAWKDGQVTGLRARGNFTVDIKWKDGKVTDYRISSPQAAEVKVKINGEVKAVKSNAK
jgi:alpha-L-fucosidase 2